LDEWWPVDMEGALRCCLLFFRPSTVFESSTRIGTKKGRHSITVRIHFGIETQSSDSSSGFSLSMTDERRNFCTTVQVEVVINPDGSKSPEAFICISFWICSAEVCNQGEERMLLAFDRKSAFDSIMLPTQSFPISLTVASPPHEI